MDAYYWSEYNARSQKLTFHVWLNAQIEMNTVGTVVSLIMGLYDKNQDIWDYMKCDVAYDGDVNTVARYYSVSDRYSVG